MTKISIEDTELSKINLSYNNIKNKRYNLQDLTSEEIDNFILTYPGKYFTPRKVTTWVMKNFTIYNNSKIETERSLVARITKHCQKLLDEKKIRIAFVKKRSVIYKH